MRGFRWRRRRGGVWLVAVVQWVSRPAPNNSTKLTSKPVPTQPLLRRDTVCVCGTAAAAWSCAWPNCDRCGWWEGMSPTCEMAYPPPPLLPRPEFPHFPHPHLAPPTNFPSLGPTNSFSTPSGYPGLFPRLPGRLLGVLIFLSFSTGWNVHIWNNIKTFCHKNISDELFPVLFITISEY